MNGFRQAALAAALIAAAGLVPAVAHAQSRDRLIRAFDLARGSRIGASVSDIEDTDAKDAKQVRAGVLVDSVEPGGPADKAGVKAGWVITAVGAKPVANADGVGSALAGFKPGQKVDVKATLPDGSTKTVSLTLGERP